VKYVIIGGGIAGTTAAEELRKLDPESEITLISLEFHAVYSRVLLPHYVKAKVPRERVFLKKETWYAEQKIEWIVGESVTKIDPVNQHVALSDQTEVAYDKLLIATGGEVKLIEQDVPGVSYFRTLDDADHMLELLRALPLEARAGIYGGGFIACEYLNIFKHFNIATTIAFRGAHMWSRALSSEAGELITNHLITNGVEVIPNAAVVEIHGEKIIEAFSVGDKKISCHILGIGVGIEPDFSLMREATIDVQDGILCNQFLETNMPNIYTVGDVAEFLDERYGRHLLAGNWMNAQMQGRCVARNMFGERTVFNLVSSYATNALGLEIIFIGDTSRAHAAESRLIGSIEAGGISELFVRNNRLVGAILVGRNSDRAVLTKLIQEQTELTDTSVILSS